MSNVCMALVNDDCLIPTKDAPELGYIKESSNEQYVPDVFYKVIIPTLRFYHFFCDFDWSMAKSNRFLHFNKKTWPELLDYFFTFGCIFRDHRNLKVNR